MLLRLIGIAAFPLIRYYAVSVDVFVVVVDLPSHSTRFNDSVEPSNLQRSADVVESMPLFPLFAFRL